MGLRSGRWMALLSGALAIHTLACGEAGQPGGGGAGGSSGNGSDCSDGAAQPGTTPCGLNGRGALDQTCATGAWVDTATCIDPDSCSDGAAQPGITPCGVAGALAQACSGGQWVDTANCIEPCNFCEVSGAGGTTFDCYLLLAASGAAQVPNGQATALQFTASWDDTLLSADGFYVTTCLVFPPFTCFEQLVPPNTLPAGHTVSVTPNPASNSAGSVTALAMNLSNTSAVITNAYLDTDGTTVVGNPEMMHLRLVLDVDVDPATPACVQISSAVGANAVPNTLLAVMNQGVMVTSLP